MTQSEASWIAILRADIETTGSITKTAERVGVSRGAVSAILNQTGSSPYANGKCSTDKLAKRVMNTIGLIVCPFLTKIHGSEHRITGLECRDTHNRERAPTNSPRAMAHFRACQSCEKRIATMPAAPAVKPARVMPAVAVNEPLQQAGVIDTVTLPLPEVGAPQVEVPT